MATSKHSPADREHDDLNAARGIITWCTVSAALWAVGFWAGGQLHAVIKARDARTCALESYGDNRSIARCYRAAGLAVPHNFDATGE